MKHLCISLILLISALCANAKPISKDHAQQFALNYMHSIGYADKSVQSAENLTAGIYLIQYVGGGWTLISTDDSCEPVVGYSPDGAFDASGMPAHMQSYISAVSNTIEQSTSLEEQAQGWSTGNKATYATIAPLIKVNWGQSGAYCQYCPNGTKGQAIVGCVALSMAQAMSVYRYPARPKGSNSYVSATYGPLSINYDEEEPYNWDDILSGANNKKEAARLMWHCGMAVDMDYAPDGSGVPSMNMGIVPNALKKHFSLSANVKNLRASDYSTSVWTEMMYNELAAGRPIIYSGYGTGGHCFNIDGYQNGMFHLNWGWSGSYDGYFNITNLKPGSNDFSQGCLATVCVEPPSGKPIDIQLDKLEVLAGAPKGTTVANATVVTDDETAQFKFEVKGGYNFLLQEYSECDFSITAFGGTLKVKNPLTLQQSPVTINITASNRDDPSKKFTKEFKIKVVNSTPNTDITVSNGATISSQAGWLSVSCASAACVCTVYKISGAVVAQAECAEGETTTISLPRGLYIVKVQGNGQTQTVKTLVR